MLNNNFNFVYFIVSFSIGMLFVYSLKPPKKYVIKSDLKNTNKIVNEIISLPMYSELKKYEVIYIIKQIKLFYSLNK